MHTFKDCVYIYKDILLLCGCSGCWDGLFCSIWESGEYKNIILCSRFAQFRLYFSKDRNPFAILFNYVRSVHEKIWYHVIVFHCISDIVKNIILSIFVLHLWFIIFTVASNLYLPYFIMQCGIFLIYICCFTFLKLFEKIYITLACIM